MDKETIHIPPIVLDWSDWVSWERLKVDSRSGGVIVPNKVAGVYGVRCVGAEQRLTIGKASDLRMRIKQGLVKGKTAHSTGKKIRANENTSEIEVRWAATERPAAAEEELHRTYRRKFNRAQNTPNIPRFNPLAPILDALMPSIFFKAFSRGKTEA